eukprot:COSAG06_NODE_9841_length_1806_cov_1.423550_2_plen_119_part_01
MLPGTDPKDWMQFAEKHVPKNGAKALLDRLEQRQQQQEEDPGLREQQEEGPGLRELGVMEQQQRVDQRRYQQQLTLLLRDCWGMKAAERPTFSAIRERLEATKLHVAVAAARDNALLEL